MKAQNTFTKVEPPFWWTGMQNDTLHLLFYGKDIKIDSINLEQENISIHDFRISTNSDYLFVDLIIKEANSGIINLRFYKGKKMQGWKYLLKKRKGYIPQGLSQEDFIYLIMPDRFANGNEKNDALKEMNQELCIRDSIYERHGGDIQGVLNHLDYLEELGVSALWLNPVESNDQEKESYHGYAITDHYTVDPRLGNNENYQQLVEELHSRKMKIIRDVVFNHFGSQHPLSINPPDTSWINTWSTYTKSNFRASVLMDPHASKKDKEQLEKGWFDTHMPDMNYNNKDLANYMIQNSIWWIENFAIDSYRIDTYVYSNQEFMKKWAKELKEEYPSLFLFAETWVHETSIQSWVVGGNKFNQGETYIDGVTDFQLYYAIKDALNQPYGWTNGASQLYYKLVDDVAYINAENNVLFLDNHDLDRFYGVVNEDYEKFKIGITFLFTLRGIPSMLYGTEILMPYMGEHGVIRTDFPGGWSTDSINKFSNSDRSSIENDAFNFIKYLANWRKNSEAIKNGKLIQFIPKDGHYMFARVSEKEIVVIIYNQNEKAIEIALSNFDEFLNGDRNYHDLLEQKSYYGLEKVSILAKSIKVLTFNLE
jgi:glycosidase